MASSQSSFNYADMDDKSKDDVNPREIQDSSSSFLLNDQFIPLIIKILKLEDDSMDSEILAKQLIMEGRQVLSKYKDDIARSVYNAQMNESGSELLNILKDYTEQLWQSDPDEWFRIFLRQQKAESPVLYNQILTRTAEYGSKHIKNNPSLSLIIQFLFEFDDKTLQDKSLFDDIWKKLTTYGLQSFKDFSEHLSKNVIKQTENDTSPLSLALRKYFRQPLLDLLNKINKPDLIELTLNFVVKYGWLEGLKKTEVQDRLAPNKFKILMKELEQYSNNNNFKISNLNSSTTQSNKKSISINSSLLPMQQTTTKQYQESDEWGCLVCTYFNPNNNTHCEMCNNSRPFNKHRSVTASQTVRRSTDSVVSKSESTPYVPPFTSTESQYMENTRMAPQKSMSELEEDTVVYIPDLPTDATDVELEEVIRTRLHISHHFEATKVKCHSNIGVGIVYVSNINQKRTLLENVGKTTINVQSKSITISFRARLELVAYLVFDQFKKLTLTTGDIARRWAELCQSNQQPTCKSISSLFPNIFKIESTSLDQLHTIKKLNIYIFGEEPIKIFIRAVCSFFDDIPYDINTPQIIAVISTEIGGQYNSDILYVQHNKPASCAVVLVKSSTFNWENVNEISLNGHICQKQSQLSFRIVVHPVLRSIPIDRIIQHQQFQNAVVKHEQRGDKLIITLRDKSVYEECLRIKGLTVNGHQMIIKPYDVITSDPTNSEINVENWYETEILDSKPDIMPFVKKPEHEIFKYKWNSQIWLEQFESVKRRQDPESDKKRRWLRVTTMLNTIGAVLKGSYLYRTDDSEREVKLETKRMQTIVYDHRSKLAFMREVSDVIVPPYLSTTVEVSKNDCFIIYKDCASAGYRPVLLNMANAEIPGGGYRQGAGAQEENLFRRSNYHLSLDAELDTMKRAERYLFTSSSEQKLLEGHEKMYPMDEFGAIYTRGITFFRDIEENGYDYLEEPVYNVCAIAMAAYKKPELKQDNNTSLTNKNAVGTRKKIENLFAIAHKHEHDCLILSAFGCGAFKNPPLHIASIFKSVIEQYAGYFKKIYFAIIDDHNTGSRLNKDGNYLPFKHVLDGLHVQPFTRKLDVNMCSGPFRIIKKSQDKVIIDDVWIFKLPPCQYGAECRNMNDAQHGKSYSHPPLCSQHSSCDQVLIDEVHKNSFTHPTQCHQGGKCKQISDEKHSRQYDHPGFCPQSGGCKEMNEEHLIKYRHLPLCNDGPVNCRLFRQNDTKHCSSCRHCTPDCSFGGNCVNFHNEDHIKGHSHPFNQPCPLTPFACQYYTEFLQTKSHSANKVKQDVEKHCLEYSHVCPFGRQCTDTNRIHTSMSIHIRRKVCPDSNNCSKMTDEEHLNSFSHPEILDIRYLCRYQAIECRDRLKADHIKRFRHIGNYNYFGVARCFDLNQGIDFVHNHYQMAKAVRDYVNSQNWRNANITIPSKILEWIHALQPIHRCSKTIFESIVVHGNIMSREYMSFLNKRKFVASAVEQHNEVRRILDQRDKKALQNHARDFIQVLVDMEFEKTYKGSSQFTSSDTEHIDTIKLKGIQLKGFLEQEKIDKIREHAINIARASLQLHANPTGIGFTPDTTFGTNKQVFSILGPNLGYYYGDIFIIFKREIMHHPDSNFAIQAATTFGQSGNAYAWRPWLKDPGTHAARIQHFHRSKLHCSVPGYDVAAALEIMALTGLNNKTMDVNVNKIQDRWTSIDSHEVFEAHLPQLVPLDYIDHIYMPKNVFKSLTPTIQQAVKSIFDRRRLTTTEHNVDPNFEKQMDPTRQAYQEYVINEIKKNLTESHSHSLHGTLVTLPASNFENHTAIPITISQSYKQYRAQKKHSDTVFIYWQAMGGDMMLILSNEFLDPRRDQSNLRCLICYIAEKPSYHIGSNYHESFSYITCGNPYQHDAYIDNHQLMRARSNSFHRGCNINDFITYCLIISLQTSEVTLIHAGSNGIYNHQKISCKFDRSELDLSKLDYIHVSAGARIVPVRNLVIQHEAIDEYHPSFDKEFKQASSAASTSLKPTSTNDLQTSSKDGSSEPKSFWDRWKGFFKGDESQSYKPCSDSVNCLLQYSTEESKDHNKKFSHPCRFSELCRNVSEHPHLVHTPHLVDKCKYDGNCYKLDDPIHRTQFRHSDLPDYLVPCRYQSQCRDKTREHLIKYSHGEKVPLPW